tara:strand:+ start:17552 stop:17788 length:237 start_codon:yes stop_codon:yes gene_type:complete
MKCKPLKLNINLNSISSNEVIKTPILLRSKDYSPMPLESPQSIKHRISVVEVEESKIEVTDEINKIKKEKEEGKYKHK